ncbi:MAG: 50S ribosomal protein L19 [Candidatus Pacebacteria bacterium]|jgi:large subunit ribosomal protein L19|nr:50S ribosomal protein L19 [bacterium]MDP6528009.1 50S ribosomal protein L19 [Candidatus Paceibacterota bacterium]MDP6659733.1 50S ribosomal protein L19 [Candidatus Paceibacterota bacterium]|tara:strand:- start:2300 stop:2833 length:534 start_codon:yes stop_codon:yes gene_type:complete
MEAAVISPVNIEDRKNIGIKPGDTVRVWQKIQEKGKTRLQAFEGLVLARKHGNEAGGTFTVRRVTGGIGVEKIFPLYSPMIDKIEIVKRSKVRRAKLYHIRNKVTREIRRAMRRMQMVDLSTESDTEEKAKADVKEDETKEEGKAEAQPEENKGETQEVAEKVKEEETPKDEKEKKE